MKFNEINRRFSNIVAEYLTNGYSINSATMGGSQGEIAKVDVTNGTEILRILVDNFPNWDENTEGVTIIVGRCTDDVRPNSSRSWGTIWNTNLEVIYTEKFYKLGEDCRTGTEYGTKEQAVKAAELRIKRYMSRNVRTQGAEDLTDKALEIGKRIVARKFNARRICKSDIKIVKSGNCYTVNYRRKSYRLH